MNQSDGSRVLERLETFISRRKISMRALSLLAGLKPYTVNRMLKGEAILEVSSLQRVAAILGVPTSAIFQEEEPSWHLAQWSHPEEITPYLEEMNDAQSCLSCVQDMDGYLVPDRMIEYGEFKRLRPLGWTDESIGYRLEKMAEYVKAARAVRERSPFVHRIIGRESYFAEAFRAFPDMVDDVVTNLHHLDGQTMLGMLRPGNWQDLQRTVGRVIEFSHWDKVSVIDDVLAMVRPTRELFMFTYHRPTVLRLRAVLEANVARVPYCFPSDRRIGLQSARESVSRSVERLQQVAIAG